MEYQLPFTITSKILKVGNKVGNDLIEIVGGMHGYWEVNLYE